MHHAVSLRLVRRGAQVELELADRGTRPTRAAVPVDALARLHGALERRLAPPPVLIPGLDVRRSDDEASAGQALGALLTQAPKLSSAIGRWLGEARGRSVRPVLLIDTDDADRSLPWELVGLDEGPLAVTDDAVVVRRLDGPPARPLPGGPLQVHVWCPDPDDDAAATLRAGLEATVTATGWPAVREVGDDVTQGPVVLHLIGHGHRLLDGFGVDLGGTAASAATAAHVLRPLLTRAVLVVVDVCEAADAQREALATLAGQLVRAGARAVVAPTQRLAVDAAAAATPALYAALAEGLTVVDAVAEARRAVRALASPHPDGRWHNLGLYVADLAALDARGDASPWRPEGWPAPADDLAALLAHARRASERADAAFVGLEHLLEAQRALDGGGAAARAASDVAGGEALRRIQKLRRVADTAPDTAGTPRLQALARGLEAGASVEDLWSLLWGGTDGALPALAGVARTQLLAGGATAETLDPEQADGELPVARDLEVLGGPEDGRRLGLTPGASVGRIGGDATVQLFDGCGVVDPYLSRHALTWAGDGRVQLRKGARRSEGAGWARVQGEVVLRVGERLELGPATCVWGVP